MGSLVIFDCDGVLVDSERLAVRTEVSILADLGWPLTEAEVIRRFVGRSAAHMQSVVEEHLGHRIDWDDQFERRYRTVFERELQPVPGIVAVLDALTEPTCVASSGTHEKLRFTLGLTGLYDRFAGRIFSASDVTHSKPAPDLFLYAASTLAVDPSRCAVVEDSVAGVEAAVAAKMTVFGFSGGVTSAEQLENAGATTFLDMSELPALLAER